MEKTFIYGLVSKIKPEEVRYVGKSDNPELRKKRHIHNTKYDLKKNKKLTHKDYWIINENFDIDIVILEECDKNIWQEREKFFLSQFKNLTNTSEGGKGGSGIKYKMLFDDVKLWVQNNLKINSCNEWYGIVKHLPDFIPSNPREVYLKKGWISWGDFLGTNNVWDNLVSYIPYEDSKKIIKNLQIKSGVEYKKFAKNNKIPNDIPNRPERYYKNRGWVSWGDFLGNRRISNNLRTFVTYDEFKDFIKKNNISSRTEFFKIRRYVDKKIPTNPNIIYKNKGWTCWGDLYL